MTYDQSQLKAIQEACDPKKKLSIITGGPGTGKTFILKGILPILKDCELLSPTGKAAARMSEITGMEASTIHRALKFDGLVWRRTKKFEVPVVIDESSMIDSALMAKILEYEPPKLILIGDDAQLEPVGRGCPFNDLIRILPGAVSRLKICHRANGAIHKASQAIRNGQSPKEHEKSDGEVFRMIETGDAEKSTDQLLKWISTGNYNPEKDMILSPRYGSSDFDGGIDSINREIKKIVNPGKGLFSVNDRIIVTNNHADVGPNGIFNGDLGFVAGIDSIGQVEIVLDREKKKNGSEETILITKDILKHIKLAYCLSVHKAQGSEADHVFILCLNSHIYQLSRSLIYTAVTRAKKAAIVMGQMKAFYAGINKVNEKRTILQYLGKTAQKTVS